MTNEKTGNGNILTSQPDAQKNSTSLEIPDDFLCPLTMEVMENPLMSRHGNNFERKAILEWIGRGKETCPITRKTLKASDLVSNGALKTRIKAWKIRNNTLGGAATASCWESDDEEEELANSNCYTVIMPAITTLEHPAVQEGTHSSSMMLVSSLAKTRKRQSSLWGIRPPRWISSSSSSSRGAGQR